MLTLNGGTVFEASTSTDAEGSASPRGRFRGRGDAVEEWTAASSTGSDSLGNRSSHTQAVRIVVAQPKSVRKMAEKGGPRDVRPCDNGSNAHSSSAEERRSRSMDGSSGAGTSRRSETRSTPLLTPRGCADDASHSQVACTNPEPPDESQAAATARKGESTKPSPGAASTTIGALQDASAFDFPLPNPIRTAARPRSNATWFVETTARAPGATVASRPSSTRGAIIRGNGVALCKTSRGTARSTMVRVSIHDHGDAATGRNATES